MATINDLRLKGEWEKWLAAQQPPAFPPRPRGMNRVLWQATKRVWRLRLAQQLPQGDQGQEP